MSITASSVVSPVQKQTDVRISSPYYTLSDDGSYCCQLCGQCYSCENYFNQHSATHFNAETLMCMLCQRVYASRDSLRYHMNEHHASGQWKCEICSAILGTRYSLKNHMEIHSDEKEFRCALCDKQLSCASSLHRHMLSHTEPEHECALCDKKFKLKHNLLCHMQSLHGNNNRPHKCEECGRAFKIAAYLTSHKLTHLAKRFTCPICDKSFTRKCHLNKHLFRHYRDDADCRNRNDESSHVRVPTKNSPLEVKCELCSPARHFSNTEDLKCHLGQHYDFGEICCDICKKRFTSKKLLRQHKKCHNNMPEKNVQCEFCKNCFKSARY